MSKIEDRLLTPRKRFLRTFEKIGRHRHRYEVWDDWTECAFCALAKITTKDVQRQDALEARYMRTIGKYTHAEAQDFKLMLDLMFEGLEKGGEEMLGSIATEIEVLSSRLGQVFSPYTICQFMAKMSLADMKPDKLIETVGHVTVGEPASGAGGMLLAFADELTNMGYNIGTTMFADATDVSYLAYKMTFIQLSCRGIPAIVRHANSLSLEQWDFAYTPSYFPFLAYHHERKEFEAKWRKMVDALKSLDVATPPPAELPPAPNPRVYYAGPPSKTIHVRPMKAEQPRDSP